MQNEEKMQNFKRKGNKIKGSCRSTKIYSTSLLSTIMRVTLSSAGEGSPGSGRFWTFLYYVLFFFFYPQSPFRILDRNIVVDERSIRERGRAEWSMRMGDWSVFCHPLKFFFKSFFFFPCKHKTVFYQCGF